MYSFVASLTRVYPIWLKQILEKKGFLIFWTGSKMTSSEIVKNQFLLITSGKLWLKMRRMSIVSLVLHFFGSSLRWTRRMDLILRALDTPDVVDYFSYPQHGQQVREKHFRGIWSQKLHSKLKRLRNFEMLMWTRKLTFCPETFFSKVSKKFLNGLITLIFSLRHVFILVLDSCKIWRAYEKNSRKYSGKSDPPHIAIWGVSI